MIDAFVVVSACFAVLVFVGSFRALRRSWEFSVFYGKKGEIASFVLLCLIIVAGYIAMMRFFLTKGVCL